MNIYELFEEGQKRGKVTIGDVLRDIHDLAKVSAGEVKDQLCNVVAECETFFVNTNSDTETPLEVAMYKLRNTDTYKDVLGGVHSECVGWSPSGEFCGECSTITCKGCKSYEQSVTGKLNSSELMYVLRKLGGMCERPQNITICGGAVMALHYKSRLSTADVDCLHVDDSLKLLSSNMKLNVSMDDDWLNDNVKVTSSYSDKLYTYAKPFCTLHNLTINMITGLPLLCMKLVSWRNDSHDLDDCTYLVNKLKDSVGIKDVYNMLNELYGTCAILPVDADLWLKKAFEVDEYLLDEESLQSMAQMIKSGLMQLIDVPTQFRSQVSGYIGK